MVVWFDSFFGNDVNLLNGLLIIWVLPNTVLGCLVGGIGLIFGGKARVRSGCIEFYGGLVAWLLRKCPLGSGAVAMTLGHSIIGQTAEGLDRSRRHEHVHVRQYERWGPLFIPAYLFCSTYLWLKGRNAYRENPFEVQAYSVADIDD